MDDKEKVTRLLERTPNLFVLHGEYEAAAEYLVENGVAAVVRCRDCCWCIVTSPPYASAYCIKELRNIIVEPDDFCSHGERKE